MDHNKPGSSNASVEGYLDVAYTGRRPNGFYIPRYRNVGKDKRDYLRGFGYQGRASRAGYEPLQRQRARSARTSRRSSQEPGPWTIGMTAFGEILPHHDDPLMPFRNTSGTFTPRFRNWSSRSMPEIVGSLQSRTMRSASAAASSEPSSASPSAKLLTAKPCQASSLLTISR